MKRLIAVVMLLPLPVAAQDLVFDIAPVTACLEAGGGGAVGGPAAVSCHLHGAARETLYLTNGVLGE